MIGHVSTSFISSTGPCGHASLRGTKEKANWGELIDPFCQFGSTQREFFNVKQNFRDQDGSAGTKAWFVVVT